MRGRYGVIKNKEKVWYDIPDNPVRLPECTCKVGLLPCRVHGWERPTHGVNCRKVEHDLNRSGYLHDPWDDRPYDVDGVTYCGRCHVAIGTW